MLEKHKPSAQWQVLMIGFKASMEDAMEMISTLKVRSSFYKKILHLFCMAVVFNLASPIVSSSDLASNVPHPVDIRTWNLTLLPLEKEYLTHWVPEIRSRIKKQWYPPKDSHDVHVRFIIMPKGEIVGSIISQSAGQAIADRAALAAVERAVPFPILPDGLEYARVEISFGYGGINFSGIDSVTNPLAIKLNNEGIACGYAGNYKMAVEKLEAAHKLNPNYQLAVDNLATIQSNYGLELQKTNPQEAIKHFHAALFYAPNKISIKENLENAIRAAHKDPKSFQDRVEAGDAAFNEKDYCGAKIEYEAALAIRDDADVRAKLESLPMTISK